jgi:predicted nucleic acid-binding protein
VSSEVFCDTSFFVALLDPKDNLHLKAVKLSEVLEQIPLCTTYEVLTETLNYFSRFGADIRKAAAGFTNAITDHTQYIVIQLNSTYYQSAICLYEGRTNKTYSCTDCISMIVMRERGIRKVATSDRHFEQEGFEILMVA